MKKIILCLFGILLYLSSSAQDKAVIDLSVAHLREEPEYVAEMGTEALMGTAVQILDKDGYWIKVQTPDGYKAWTNEMSLEFMTDEEFSAYEKAPKFICLAVNSTIYSEPNKKSQSISDLVRGNIVLDKGSKKKGFLKISTASGREGWVSKKDLASYSQWQKSRICSGENIVNEALKYVGVPYLWGGNSIKGFDCSGLTSFSFLMNGMLLPRNASQQARIGNLIDSSGLGNGDFSLLKKGDLLFFGDKESGRVTHVGIYIGDGRMIHASQLVRINSIIEGRADCYENMHRLLHIRRICDE